MGLLEKIFKRPGYIPGQQVFRTLTAYSPVFTSWGGAIYESELVRAAIHAKAIHMSKLAIQVQGTAKPNLTRRLKVRPNDWQTWGQFLYRLSTILEVENTAFIVPVMDDYLNITGVFPVLPTRCQVMEYEGEPWLRYQFAAGEHASVEMRYCGIMTKFQYSDDLFGDDNTALNPTMDLVHIQNQGIQEAIKNSATFRFFAKVNNFSKGTDLEKEKERFNQENMQKGGGILLFPNTYSDIKQIDSKPFVVDATQMQQIRQNVYTYFGVNEDVLQNKAYGDAWSAFYEGAIEPFAIQLSDVLTHMLFTDREKASVMLTANRLQYMSNTEKLNVSSQMADRGIMNRDEIREIWNLPPLPDGQGQAYTIRGEYYLMNGDGSVTKKGDDLTSGT